MTCRLRVDLKWPSLPPSIEIQIEILAGGTNNCSAFCA